MLWKRCLRREEMHMPILQALRWLLLVAEVGVAAPVLYLCILSFSAILMAKKRKLEKIGPKLSSYFNFAILVPAHDEEVVLGTLLESLSALEYPKDLYTVYVV